MTSPSQTEVMGPGIPHREVYLDGSVASVQGEGSDDLIGTQKRRIWIIAGSAVVGLGCALMTVRGWSHADPGQLEDAARLALKNHQWDHAEALLKRLSQERSPTSEDAMLGAELEIGRGRAEEALRLLAGVRA